MRQVFRRFRSKVRRRWILTGVGGVVGVLIVILIPWRSRAGGLELLVLGADGRFSESVRIPRQWADTTGLASGAVLRVPLVFGLQNSGNKAYEPSRLELSMPIRFRLVRSDGQPLTGELTPGTPLIRYHLDLQTGTIRAGQAAIRFPKLDTIWLEPIIPSFYCMTFADSVPEFVPSPPAPIEAISRVSIFYSFNEEGVSQRQTGLLTIQLDPALLRQEAPEPPPVYPVSYREPAAPMPPFNSLQYMGSTRAFCGEPEDPMELLVTLWQTPEGGRFFVLDHGGAPRKYLFDLNRDSIIELEMWDPDADGRFEAWRAARLPIPSFIMPPQSAPAYDLAMVFDAIDPDSLYLIDRYATVLRGRYQYRTKPPDTTPRISRYRPTILQGVEDEDGKPRRAVGGYTEVPYTPQPLGRPLPGRTDQSPAGPPPVTAPPAGQTPPEQPPTERPETPAQPETEEAPRPQAPEPARPSGPKLLGRPRDSIPATPRPR